MELSHRIEPQAPAAAPAWRGLVGRMLTLATPTDRRAPAADRPKPTMALYAWRRDDPRD